MDEALDRVARGAAVAGLADVGLTARSTDVDVVDVTAPPAPG